MTGINLFPGKLAVNDKAGFMGNVRHHFSFNKLTNHKIEIRVCF